MPTKPVTLRSLIDEVKSIKGGTIKQYRRNALAQFRKMNLSYLGHGATCEVFSSKNLNYVVKLSDHEGLPFKPAKEYIEGYLKPSFVSSNGWIAIQLKAETVKSIYDERKQLLEILHEVSEESKDLRAVIDFSRLKLDNLIEKEVELTNKIATLETKRLLLTEKNVCNYKRIPDIHSANIGIHRNRILCIDLNSQFKKTHYEEGEQHD